MTTEEFEAKILELETTNTSLVVSIGKLETANKDLLGQRQTLKDKIRDGSGDEELRAENEKLLGIVESQDERFKDVETNHKSEMDAMKLVSMFDDLGVKAKNEQTKKLLMPLLMDGSDFAEDGFRYMDEDKTTRFKEDNSKYGLMDKINDLKDGGYDGLFETSKGGGASDAPVAPTKSSVGDIIDAGLTY